MSEQNTETTAIDKKGSQNLNFFSVDGDSDEELRDSSDDEASENEGSASPAQADEVVDNGITKEDAELVLDEYRSARTSGLPPPNVMFAASKKPEFLKASTVASKWDGEKQLTNLRAERARKLINPDVISASAKANDDWDAGEKSKKRPKKS